MTPFQDVMYVLISAVGLLGGGWLVLWFIGATRAPWDPASPRYRGPSVDDEFVPDYPRADDSPALVRRDTDENFRQLRKPDATSPVEYIRLWIQDPWPLVPAALKTAGCHSTALSQGCRIT